MDKKIFEDLPSTKTPINSSNLNEMQSNIEKSAVIISATEPTTSERVWIKKGKNHFNKNNVISGYRLDASGNLYATSSYCTSLFILINPDTTYTVNYTMSTNRRIAFYDADKKFILANTTDKTFTTTANAYYLRLGIDETLLDSAQLEQDTASTNYEAYIEPKVYLKNDNGIFEELVKAGSKTETIWEGSLYEADSSITLAEPLKKNNLYILSFYGMSSYYIVQVPFTYRNNQFQTAYSDGTSSFRIRLDITNNGQTISINSGSINNASNTALIAIEKVC